MTSWGIVADDEQESFELWQEVYDSDGAIIVSALSANIYTVAPVLHDRLFSPQWVPGINNESEQARGLAAAFPMWDRGATIQDVAGRQNLSLESQHAFAVDSKLGNVLQLIDGHTYSIGGSPALLKESNGFSVACWIRPESNGVIVGRLDGEDDFRWYLSASTTTCTLQFKVDGSLISMTGTIDIAHDEWSHLVATIRKIGTDTYGGEVYVDGRYVDSFGFTAITTASMDTTGNITLGGVAAEVTGRFPPLTIGSASDRWENEEFDSIIDSEESVNDDPTAYTDTTYWTYDYNPDDEWLTQQFVTGHTGSASYPAGLRLRMAIKTDPHTGSGLSITVIRRVYVIFNAGEGNQNLVAYEPGNDPEDGFVIPDDNELHVIELDLQTLPVDGYDSDWAVNIVFSSSGATSHTVTLYDFDLIESVSSYRGCLKDLRIYNRPLANLEIEQISYHGERLYEMPSFFAGLGYDPSIPISGSGGVVIGGTSTVNVLVNGVAALLLGGNAALTSTTTPAVTGGAVLGGSALLRMDWHIVPTGGVRLSRYPYRYKRTITVPAGTVTESYRSFYLGVIVDLDPAKVVGANFVFTDIAMRPISFEVREYDADSGRLTAYVRTPLSSSTDTILYIFYGAA